MKHYVIALKDHSDEEVMYEIDFFADPEVTAGFLDVLGSVPWLSARVSEETDKEFDLYTVGYWDKNESFVDVELLEVSEEGLEDNDESTEIP